jgi:hypothetical protein
MKRFFKQLIFFTFLLVIIGEILIRSFGLVPDIPRRFIDENTGIQMYKPKQSGYFKNLKVKWIVNDYGWLGISNIDKNPLFSIIGDSFIENIMNPISCNQGSLLQARFADFSFFEAGRSGVTFIESLEISKYLDTLIQPKYHLIYLSDGDFIESIVSKGRKNDIMQIDLNKKEIIRAELKSPWLKRILYSIKSLYYMYLRFPLFVEKQNPSVTMKSSAQSKFEFSDLELIKLFEYCSTNYNLNKILLIFHPDTDERIIKIAKSFHFSNFKLKKSNNSWSFSDEDDHWSCYGHEEAANQIAPIIDSIAKRQ